MSLENKEFQQCKTWEDGEDLCREQEDDVGCWKEENSGVGSWITVLSPFPSVHPNSHHSFHWDLRLYLIEVPKNFKNCKEEAFI